GMPREVHARRQVEREPFHLVAELVRHGRGREAAVADDLGRDALTDLRFRTPIAPEPPVGVRVHVDESRRDGEAPRLDRASGWLAREIADRADRIADDADVAMPGGLRGSVDEPGSFDLDVEHRGPPRS